MGNYNPHSPDILGNEWVPIKQANLLPDLATEHGYTFRLEHTTHAASGTFFLADPVVGSSTQIHQVNLYRSGYEDQTGPVKRVVIEANNGSITDGTATLTNAATVAEALERLDGTKYIWLEDPGGVEIDVYFAVNNYSSQLAGKRILAVNLLYFATTSDDPPDNVTSSFGANIVAPTASPTNEGAEDIGELIVSPRGGNVAAVQSISLGAASVFPTNTDLEKRRYSWTWQDLQRFEQSATNRIAVQFDGFGQDSSGADGDTIELDYAALEVIYCEENRLAFGGRTSYAGRSAAQNYVLGPLDEGQHLVPLRTSSNMVTGLSLPPGEYTLTVGMLDAGAENNTGAKPTYSAIRQLYELPTHRGVRITHNTKVGGTPLVESSDVIPMVALHTRTTAITGVHAYDTSLGAPVYAGVTVTQEVDCVGQKAPATATAYPQVRFYARRFGDTDVPLTLTGLDDANLASVSITVDEFDELPEIVDGWREVTLRFDTPYPTFTSSVTAPDWRWSADGLNAGSRWEILVADNLGYITGSTLMVLSAATYGAPFGSAVDLTYGGALAQTGDGPLIFSMDPPAVTGLAVTVEDQELVAIGTDDCGIDLACVPTALQYNRVTWASVIPLQVSDEFGRTAASGWGSSSLGAYQIAPTANSYVFSVNGSEGIFDVSTLNSSRRVMFPSTFSTDDVFMEYEFSVDELPVGANAELSPMLRIDPADVGNNYYYGEVTITPQGGVQVRLMINSGGTTSPLTTTQPLPGLTVVPGEYLRVFTQVRGSTLRLAVRALDDPKPEFWDTSYGSSTYTSGRFGLRAVLNTGLTNTLPFRFRVRNLVVYYIGHDIDFNSFGYYELQRHDEDDETADTWNTILHATSPVVTGFSDFEARVGVQSDYRIRVVNVLDFAGSWSNEQSETIPAPGITGSRDGNSVLIFTSNDRQDGSVSLAYTQVWDGDVAEDFEFPEAANIQLRELYRRDFTVAFRPTERGGERFTRVMLVQQAAVPEDRIREGFRSLRDMAWEDVSYVCVRNELGDRWFAAVTVPSGRVQRNRRLFLAQVNVIEVSDTPCVVELAENES